MRALLYLLCFNIVLASCTTNHEVDLIVHNARVYTVDSSFTISEAFAVNNGVFIEIGTSDQILGRYKAKDTIDAGGAAIYPGFYDAHAHFLLFADGLEIADLTGASSFDEVIDRLKAHHNAHPDKKWIIGKSWDQNRWEDKQFPTKDSLDKYFPETPVFLTRVDYHAALVNSKALSIAGIDSAIYVEGGLILTDSIGNLSGLLLDKAIDLVRQHIPDPDDSEIVRILTRAQDSLFSVGLTSIVDAGLTERELELLKNLYTGNKLKIRNYAMISDDPKVVSRLIRGGFYDDGRLHIRSVKLMADGALGSRGACLLKPYSDDTTNHGFLLNTPEEFDRIIKELANTNFQVNTHAIGDSANRFILDTYGKYLTNNAKRRWRIEHAQIVDEADFEKFDRFKIIPSIQPTHATSDMYWAEERVGPDRIGHAYAFKRLKDVYGLVAIGSDFPVESHNPLYGFHAAVARVDASGYPQGGYDMKNALTREEALMGMTTWAAFSCFQEDRRGSIARGKDADFIILEDDIMTAPYEKLRDIKTLRTVVGGETVFLRD